MQMLNSHSICTTLKSGFVEKQQWCEGFISKKNDISVRMANFSSVSDLSFPNPSSARKPTASNVTAPPLLSQSFFSNSVSGIQLPSPVYASSPIRTSSLSSVNGIITSTTKASLYPAINSRDDIQRFFQKRVDGASDWHHNVPSTMPWVESNRLDSSVMQMSITNKVSPVENLHARRLKRRAANSSWEIDAGPQSKVFINEDRVAEGMRNLQLGSVANNNSSVTSNRNQAWNGVQNIETGDMEDEPLCASSPRLELSKELKAGLTKKDLVQQLIMEEMNKSCKQLVLWRPPGNHIKQILSGDATCTNSAQLSRTLDVIDMGVARSHVTAAASVASVSQKAIFNSSAMDDVSEGDVTSNCQMPESSVAMDASVLPSNGNSFRTPQPPPQSVLPGNGLVLPTIRRYQGNDENIPPHCGNNNNVTSYNAFQNPLPFTTSPMVPDVGRSVSPAGGVHHFNHIEHSTVDAMENDLDL